MLTDTLVAEMFTPRQAELALLVSEGLSNAAVSDRMTIELRTVERHMGMIFEKMNIPEGHHKRVCLALFAYQHRNALRLRGNEKVGRDAPEPMNSELWGDVLTEATRS